MVLTYPVELTTARSVIVLLAITAVSGALGGGAAELAVVRGARKETGEIERPHRAGRYLTDLGGWSRVLLGMAAALVALVLLPLGDDLTQAGGSVVHRYNLVAVISFSVLIGYAAPAFLAQASARVISALAEGQAEADKQKAETEKAHADKQSKRLVAQAGKATELAVKSHVASQVGPVLDAAEAATPHAVVRELKAHGALDRGDNLKLAETAEPLELLLPSPPGARASELSSAIDAAASEAAADVEALLAAADT